MEHHKISKLLNDSAVSKFVTRKWIEVKNFKTLMLRSDLCDYNDAYIFVKGRIIVTNNNNRRSKKLTFKNNASPRSCI